jgi:membrane protease YdiL (CAAX protease family)
LFALGDFSSISLALAVLVVGEEIGWRGHALPALIGRHSPLRASLVVGLLWALWHLPNFVMAEYPHYGRSFLLFAAATVGYSVLFGWIYVHTQGSIFLATWFHAAINLFSPIGIAAARADALEACLYGLAAGLVILVTGPRLRRTPKNRGFPSTP